MPPGGPEGKMNINISNTLIIKGSSFDLDVNVKHIVRTG